MPFEFDVEGERSKFAIRDGLASFKYPHELGDSILVNASLSGGVEDRLEIAEPGVRALGVFYCGVDENSTSPRYSLTVNVPEPVTFVKHTVLESFPSSGMGRAA